MKLMLAEMLCMAKMIANTQTNSNFKKFSASPNEKNHNTLKMSVKVLSIKGVEIQTQAVS